MKKESAFSGSFKMAPSLPNLADVFPNKEDQETIRNLERLVSGFILLTASLIAFSIIIG